MFFLKKMQPVVLLQTGQTHLSEQNMSFADMITFLQYIKEGGQ